MKKYIFTNRGNDTTTSETVCVIAFCIFTFSFLFFYQSDILTMEQHILSGGLTKYNKTIGSIIITALLYLLHLGLDEATGKCVRYPALTYLPSAILLAMLTDVNPDIEYGYDLGKWSWILPLFLIIYGIVLYYAANRIDSSDSESNMNHYQQISVNLLILLCTFLCVGCLSNSNRTFHKRMEIDNLIAQHKFKDALAVETMPTDNDSNITMLRAFALAKESMLGDKLFEYRPKGGSDALLPYKRTKCLIASNNEIYNFIAKPVKQQMRPMKYLVWMKNHRLAKKPLRDYMLCGLLLDKQIDLFVKELMNEKNIELKKLPKHYKEALILYNHIRTTPIVTYNNVIMDADYLDMQTIMRSSYNKAMTKAKAEKSFGNTYWYYFFYE